MYVVYLWFSGKMDAFFHPIYLEAVSQKGHIWSILTKLRQLRFSGGHFQTNATITSFEGLVG